MQTTGGSGVDRGDVRDRKGKPVESQPPSRTRRARWQFVLRHAGIVVATLMAWLLREPLQVGTAVIAILGVAIALNLGLEWFSEHRRFGPFVSLLSPFVGMIAWSSLLCLTGGAGSPFVAGLWLEVILTTLSGRPALVLLTSMGGVLGLWVQELAAHPQPGLETAFLQSAFLFAMGGLTALWTQRWHSARRHLRRERVKLRRRLRRLEAELDVLRLTRGLGEPAARLAHALKNSVHSLRGFLSVLEPELPATYSAGRALAGLRMATDRLEEVVRSTIGRSVPALKTEVVDEVDVEETLDLVIEELAVAYPQVRWTHSACSDLPAVRAPGALLQDLVLCLCRNAAEAMQGRGEVHLAARHSAGMVELSVEDTGTGMSEDTIRNLCTPGFTTKPDGSGLGLFLARRLLEDSGGYLSAANRLQGGAVVAAALPAVERQGVR